MRIDGSAELVGQLRHVIQPAFRDLQVLQLPGILHAEQKWYRRVLERCALRPSYALHPGNSFNSENPLGEFVQDEEVGRIAHIVIGLDHQNFRHHARLREVPLCGRHSDVAGHGLGYVVAVFVAHLVSGKCQQADEGNRARRDENRRGPAHDGSTHPSPSPHLERSLGIKETKTTADRKNRGNQGQRDRDRDNHAHRAWGAHGLENRQSGETKAIRRARNRQTRGQDDGSDSAIGGVVRLFPIFAGLTRLVIPPDEKYPVVRSRSDREGYQDIDSKSREPNDVVIAQERDNSSSRRQLDPDHCQQ